MELMMRPDHTPDERACLPDDASIPITTRDHKQHETSLACDAPKNSVPDEESLFGCPCCMNPWFR
jgi:hypothetical protein